jgi:hypothetical protein
LFAPLDCTINAFTVHYDDFAVRVTGDRPTSRQVFYACEKAICVEPFVRLDATSTWTNTYEIHR